MKYLSILGLLLPSALPVLAQQVPDAGQVLQETQLPELQAPQPAPDFDITAPDDGEQNTPPGGPTVTLQALKLVGNSVFSDAELLGLLGEVRGRSFDLAGLRELARRITVFYREQGYPFARALLPAQRLGDGTLTVQIIEGRYGKVEAQGDFAPQAQFFLTDLAPGDVIASDTLERAVLTLSDQPGVTISPLIRPGQEVGTGDLIVKVERKPTFLSRQGLDNHGNRYTGQNRLRSDLRADSPFTLGDQFLANLLYTEEGLWLGNLSYSLPLDHSGLRGRIGYSHTYYELGEEFAELDAQGTAKVTSLGLTYPVIRTQQTKLVLGFSFLHKALEDRQDAISIRNDKKSDVLPVTLQFEQRDSGGITYGTFTYSAGNLDLDAELKAIDIASGSDTRGHFDKWNLDLVRLQGTPVTGLTLYGRTSVQRANDNLDSSESFFLGGASGVRAYPQGEGAGDEGWLVQVEARYRFGAAEPFLFYDAGKTRINAKPGNIRPAVIDNTRSIAGSGLGLRYQYGPWNLDAAIAWRNRGGKPESDSRDRNPRLWLAASWQF